MTLNHWRFNRTRLLQVEQYALQRYYASWRCHSLIMGCMWIAAANRANRRVRVLRQIPSREGV